MTFRGTHVVRIDSAVYDFQLILHVKLLSTGTRKKECQALSLSLVTEGLERFISLSTFLTLTPTKVEKYHFWELYIF